MPKKRSELHSQSQKLIIFIIFTLTYIASFFMVYDNIGNIAIAFAILPAVAGGWFYGKKYGFFISLVLLLFNFQLISLKTQEIGNIGTPGIVMGSTFILIAGVLFGWASNVNYLLKKELKERKQAEEELLQSKSQFRSVFNGVNDAILVETIDGKVLDVNTRACEMFGWTYEEFLTKSLIDMVPPENRAVSTEAQDEDDLTVEHFETINMRANGERFPVSVTGRIEKIGGKKRLLIVVRDITERMLVDQELQEQTHALNERVKELDCLYGISTLVDKKNITLNEIFKGVVNLIPPGWQYPEITCARITLNGKEFQTNNFRETIWKQSAEIVVHSKKVGKIEVFSLEEKTELDEELFLKEEEHLLNLISIRLANIITRVRAEEELLKLSRAITQSPAAIVITDLKGTIEFVNPAFTRITGYTTEEALGQNPSILQSGEHGSEFYKVLWETISAGKTWSGEFRNKSKTGEFFWESASISPVANAEGDIKNYVAVKEDITLRKQAMADLEKAKEAAEAAAQAKTDFLANMSHEIRTPLNAIYGMTSLMQDTPLNDEQQDFIKTIRDGRDTLLSVINDILDFSKIEAGKMELEEHPFRVRGCIEDTLDLLAEKSAKKMLELAYIIEDGVPPMVIGDVTRIRQILVNLLNNALKFTDKGEVVVLLKSMLLEKNQYELQFSIRDTGIGIPKDKTGRLFQSFSQVDTSTTRKYGGTGLGLAISKELAEKMGGRMWVESEEGKGSTFHFTVIAKAEETAPLISIDQYSDFSGKRILIVDDNATNRLILIKQTESWGMKPTAVESGKEALALFDKETFDIAILDMQMPEMDEFTLSERISEMNTKNNLPMIILTSIKRDKTRATDSKIAAFLNKPIKTSNLFNVLNSIISSASAVKTKKTKKENAMDSTVAVRHPLRVLLVEDNMINQKVAAKILSRLGYQSDIASNGFEAIESLERQPYDVVFMDIQMPEMDGNEATKRIRDRWPKDHQPYIIAMTAHALEGDREKYIARGMDDYVSKPIKVDALIAALEKAKPVERKSA